MAHKWNVEASAWYANYQGAEEDFTIIELTDEEYAALMAQYEVGGKAFQVVDGALTVVDSNTLYPQAFYDAQDADSDAKDALASTDWKVIRELERLYLAGTDLNNEREALRAQVTHPVPPEIS